MSDIGLSHVLIVSTMLFFIGVYGFLTRKNVIARLIAAELILNAALINFVAFNCFLWPDTTEGSVFTVFAIMLAVASVIVAAAIIVHLWRMRNAQDPESTDGIEL